MKKNFLFLLVLIAGFMLGRLSDKLVQIAEAVGGNNYLIHACVKPNGSLKIVNSGSDCQSDEEKLKWQKGDGLGGFMSSNLDGADLRAHALSYRDFSNMSLRGAQLAGSAAGSNFKNSDLDGAGMGNMLFFASTNFTNTVLTNTDFSGSTFDNVNLSNRDLSGAVMVGTTFTQSNLQGTNFTNSPMQSADLSSSTIQGANFTNANLEGARIDGLDFTNVIWDNTVCPDGSNSDTNGNTCVGHTLI